jgi:hypothetical protein
VLQSRSGPTPDVQAAAAGRHATTLPPAHFERQAQSVERAFRGGAPRAPTREMRAPALNMEHTNVAPRPVESPKTPHRNARAADVEQIPSTSGSTQATSETAHLTGPPEQDLNPLIYTLYAKIKRELEIERERKGGLY